MITQAAFACPCCGRLVLNDKLWDLAVKAYNITPYKITSGFRCEKHNRKVGGKLNSEHLTGSAMDVLVEDSKRRMQLLEAFVTSGFKRIGIGSNFIHVDVGERVSPRCWLY